MRLLGVYIENIRSYVKTLIVFPVKGIITIYGPSGSGKTSLLMSIRFALFGAAAGSRSRELFDAYKEPHGVDLLRANTMRGKVRLLFSMGNKLYVVERVIEKQGDSYSSTRGLIEEYIIDEGKVKPLSIKTFMSRKELDDYVFNILGLREKRSEKGTATPLVFTTALYVPQFNTHEVLQLDKATRIEIIERALGLDKYKLFKSNYEKISKILDKRISIAETRLNEYLRILRDKNKEKLLRQLDVLLAEQKKLEREKELVEEEYRKMREFEKSITDKIQELEIKKQELRSLIREHDNKRKKLQEIEKKIMEALGLEKIDNETLEKRLLKKEDEIKEFNRERSLIEDQLKELEVKLEKIELELKNVREKILETEKLISEKRKAIELKEKTIHELEKEYDDVEELIKKGVCPVCKQPIPHEHGLLLISEKKRKIDSEKRVLAELESELNRLIEKANELKAIETKIESSKREIIDLRQKLAKKRDSILETIEKITTEKAKFSELIAQRAMLIDELSRIDINTVKDNLEAIEKEVNDQKLSLEQVELSIKSIIDKKDKLSKEMGRIEESIKSIEKELRELDRISGEIDRIQKELNTYRKTNEILENAIKAVDEIEKRILKILVDEFRQHFYRYLDMLISDQPVDVVVTDDFALTQKIRIGRTLFNVASLSGGQNIAISLAYRLALNQTVRQYSPTLKKSVLILDEPTTGFSREIVARLKEILRTMSGLEGQVIVVTHDDSLIEAGDCRIKLSLDSQEHRTIVEYEECTMSDEYRELVSRLLLMGYSRERLEIEETSVRFEPRIEQHGERSNGKKSILDFTIEKSS
ncbi:MAG: SMC family ATPase [Desulfurococcaceae archaeon]